MLYNVFGSRCRVGRFDFRTARSMLNRIDNIFASSRDNISIGMKRRTDKQKER